MGPEPKQTAPAFLHGVKKFYQSKLDKTTPHLKFRWSFTVFSVTLFLLRVVLSQGWYMVTYGLGIYYLSLFVAFITPQIDPELNGKK